MANATARKNAVREEVTKFVMEALNTAEFTTEDPIVITKNGILVRTAEFDVVLTPVVKKERVDVEAEILELEVKENAAREREEAREAAKAKREAEKARKAAEREAKKAANAKAKAEANEEPADEATE